MAPWDGSGNVTRTNGTNSGTTVWQDDRDDGVNIRADRHDTHDEDLANALENTVALDGQTTTTTDNSLLWYDGTDNRFEGFEVVANRIVGRDGTNDVGALTAETAQRILGDDEHATDSGTDAYVSATTTTAPSAGVRIYRDFQSPSTTTTPTLDSLTVTTKDGSALWAGALSGVHELQLASGGGSWLVLDPNPVSANSANAPVKRDSSGRTKFSDPSADQDAGTKFYIDKRSPINIVTDFDADDTGTNSITTAFNNALASADNDNRILHFPPGSFRFGSKPNDIASSVTIEGSGVSRTGLQRDYAEAGGNNIGLLTYRLGSDSSVLRNLQIVATSTSSGGTGFSVLPESDDNISWLDFENVKVTDKGTDDWANFAFVMDGTPASTAPIGVRDCSLRNVWAFGAPTRAAYLAGVQTLSWHGGGTFSAGGTNGDLRLTGTAGVPSTSCTISVGQIGGDLSLGQCEKIQVVSAITGNLENGSAATDCVVLGRVEGTVQANWTNSTHYGA